MMPSIYGLYDGQGRLRYIGKANDPTARLASHMRDMKRRHGPLQNWLRKHGIPEMRVLISDSADWRNDEKMLIAEARTRGEKLLNVAEGGDEPYCPIEVRAANGAAIAKAIHSDAKRRRFWELKRSLGEAVRRGFASQTLIERMKRRPDVFGDILVNAKIV